MVLFCDNLNVSALRELRLIKIILAKPETQEDYKLGVSLSYIVRY